MSKNKSSLIKNATLYTIFNIINAVTPFLLLPILTTHLSNEGYGIVAIFSIFINILTPLIGLSTNGAITKKYFVLEKNEFKKYVGNSLIIFIFSIAIISGIVSIFSEIIEEATSIPFKWLICGIIISSCIYLHTLILTIWQVQEMPLRFGLFQLTNSLLNLLLSIFLVVNLEENWEGRLNAWLISAVFMAGIAFVFLWKKNYLNIYYDKKHMKHALKYSLPLIPHAISGMMIGFSDRLIIKNVLGLGETGIYTVAFQLGSVMTLIMTAFNNAYIPWLFAHLKQDDFEKKRQITALTYLCFGGIIVLVFAGSIFNKTFTPFIIGEGFLRAKDYVVYLLAAFGFNGMYLLITNYLFYAEKTKLLAKNTLLVSLLNIPICYFMTVTWALTGAALATAIAYLLLFLTTWYQSAKTYKMPWLNPSFRQLK